MHTPKKSQKTKRKNLQWRAETERPLAVCMTINKIDTLPQTLPRKQQEFLDDLFKGYLWGAATHVSAF